MAYGSTGAEAPEPSPSLKAGEPDAAAADASFDDAILAAIDEHDPDHDDESDLHVAEAGDGAKAKAEPKDDEGEGDEEDEDADADELDEEQASDEDEDAEPVEADDAGDEDEEDDEEDQLHRAWNALREQEVPASVLKNMPKAKLIAWGMKVIEKGKAPDGARTDSTQPDANDGDAAKKEDTGAAAQPARVDRSLASKAFAEELGVDEAAASKALAPLLDHIDQLSERVEKASGAATAAERAALSRQGQAEIESQMARLGRKYPGLDKDEERQEAILDEVRTRVAGMKALGKEIDPRSVFEAAALHVNGRPKRSDMKQLRRNGTSTAPTTRPDRLSDAPADENDYFARVLDEVDAGRIDRAKRIKPPPRQTTNRR